jgi:hypothetical protein
MYPKGTNVLVSVNIELLLETLKPGLTHVGEWVNIVGFVLDGSRAAQAERASAHVQALMVWSTGPLDVGQYEKAVEDAIQSA